MFRQLQSLLLAMTSLVLGVSFYFQYSLGMQPCSLCVMQRLCVFMIGLWGLMAIMVSSLKRARVATAMQVFFSCAGLFFVGRQLWLQFYSVSHASCMPGLDILMKYFSWIDVLHALFWGSGDCSEVHWQWLGMSMPVWAGFYFLVVLFLNMYIFGCIHQMLSRKLN